MSQSKRILTFAVALIIGAAAAWIMMPRWQLQRAVEQIAATHAPTRDVGWTWFASSPKRGADVRAKRHLREINHRLHTAPDAALLEAGDRLRSLAVWGWDEQPHDLLVRELRLRSEMDEVDQGIVLNELHDAPLDLPVDDVLPIVRQLLIAESAGARREALVVALGWLRRDRAQRLNVDDCDESDVHLRRELRLAHAWSDPPVPPETDDPSVLQSLDVDELEAAMMQLLRSDPDALPEIVQVLADSPVEPQPAVSYVLRFSRADEARELLERRAEQTDATARFALQAIDPEREQAEAMRILDDEREPMWRRRVAAWRRGTLDGGMVRLLIEDEPVDDAGHVYAAALIAERHLSRNEAIELAERWLRDLHDDHKRAGGVLAALLGEHHLLVREALEASADPKVRTSLRVALWALGEAYGDDEPVEFAHRALRRHDRDFDPDTAVCMLLAGYEPIVQYLVSRPTLEEPMMRGSVQKRSMLIERFLPQWHERIGRPSGGDPRAITLHFDSLRAMWMLDQRRLSLHIRPGE